MSTDVKDTYSLYCLIMYQVYAMQIVNAMGNKTITSTIVAFDNCLLYSDAVINQ